MPTSAGTTRVGPFEILREIGRGGMGVVYAARDTRLDREVAIKALPELLARNPDRLARFQREARLLASLNHPHIAAIYGLEEIDGRSYLALEFVDGETLEALLKRRGALPVDEALSTALQIARAVEAAHERGVIHRDLKPANIKINSAGDVKVLDFGLAKALDPTTSLVPGAGDETTQPPPGSTIATVPGLVLGSPGYLSPEQARGQPADRRTDVFSFGCILYEMLTGTSLFVGQSVGDSIGATLYKDPDWKLLPANTPPTVRLLLRRCLQKDARKRLHDIADARLDLEEAIADPTGSMLSISAGAYAVRPWRRRVAPFAVGALLLVLGVAGGWFGSQWRAPAAAPVQRDVIRFTISAPEGTRLQTLADSDMGHVAISRDGKLLAYQASVEGQSRMFIREMDSGRVREIEAARGGYGPFFSHDGRWLGFVDNNRLMRVAVSGGPASPIASGVSPNGRAAWLSNGRIVFTGPGGQGLYWVSAEGGQPTLIVQSQRGQAGVESEQKPILGFASAQPLPDGKSVLAPIWCGDTLDDYELTIVDTETGELKRVLSHAAVAMTIGKDTLVFLRNSTLLAVRFDPVRLQPVGESVPVLDGVVAESWAADAEFAISENGTIVYVPGGRICEGRRLVRIDAAGQQTKIGRPGDFVGQLSVSPDGRHFTVSTLRRKLELWVHELERGTMTLVNSEGESYEPVWSPDGTELAFVVEGRDPTIVRKQVFSGSMAKVVLRGSDYYPSSWSGDGRLLLSHQNHDAQNQTDVAVLDLNTGGAAAKPQPLLATSAAEGAARVSPDGNWMLYLSDVSGQAEVYLARYPFDGRSWQISVGGGTWPMWRGSAEAAFIDDEEQLRAVSLTLQPGKDPVMAPPQLVMALRPTIATASWGYIAPLPDGQFVALAAAPWETVEPQLEVIVNWGQEVASRLAQK